MALARLLREWRDRLFRLRAVGTQAAPEIAWLVAIRVRILTFLLARYEPVEHEPEPPEPDGAPPAPLEPFCAVDNPQGPPPRRGPEISPVLRDIRRCNAESRPRWRFWL